MTPFSSTRLAWSVAIASLALWVTSAPISWGRMADDATRLIGDAVPQQADDAPPADDSSSQLAPCPPAPSSTSTGTTTSISTSTSTTPDVAAPVPPAPAPNQNQQATFHLCGPDPQSERAIAQLIAGHTFSASVSARGDGCADLTIRVNPQLAGGSATSQMNVSLGSGQSLTIQIISENGATRVSIGAGQAGR
jgi:hypothetical protein